MKRTKYFTKPILCTLFMSLVTWGSYRLGSLFLPPLFALLLSVFLSILAYGAAILGLHVLNRKELLEFPGGGYLVRLLHL